MRDPQHLYKHGNATGVSIPRDMLRALNWVCGQSIMVELAESCDYVIIRKPRYEDFGPTLSPQAVAAHRGAQR